MLPTFERDLCHIKVCFRVLLNKLNYFHLPQDILYILYLCYGGKQLRQNNLVLRMLARKAERSRQPIRKQMPVMRSVLIGWLWIASGAFQLLDMQKVA